MKKNNDRKKIVIFGGAFSPPHLGHAIVIETIMRLVKCDEVWVMPSYDRHDKTITYSGKDRMIMLKIMIKELFPKASVPIKISSFEVDQKVLTLTYDTKLELEKKYPNNDFYFMVGGDVVGDIKDKWIKGRELYEEANFIVLRRYSVEMPLNLPKNFKIHNEEVISNEISSTFIRGIIKNGRSGVPYITIGVAEYIKKKKLYN